MNGDEIPPTRYQTTLPLSLVLVEIFIIHQPIKGDSFFSDIAKITVLRPYEQRMAETTKKRAFTFDEIMRNVKAKETI